MFRCQGREIIRVPVAKNPVPNPSTSSSSESVFSCDKCDGTGWGSETELILHENIWHKQEIWDLVNESSVAKPVCLVCLKKQPNLTLLHQHYKKIHLLSSPTARRVEREIFICHICQQLFFNKSVLEAHIFYRHARRNNVYKFHCPLCFKQMSRKGLKPHVKTHQLRSVSCCPICLIKCDTRKSVLEHVEATHRKHLLCNVCGYSTNREDNFNRHLDLCETQTMEGGIQYDMYFVIPRETKMWKPSSLNCGLAGLELYNDIHICVLCRHICYSKSQAIKHIWRDHNYVKPTTVKKIHKCNCGEEFTNAVLLKHHLFKMKENGHFHVKDTSIHALE